MPKPRRPARAAPVPQPAPRDLRPVIAVGLMLIVLLSWLFGWLPGYRRPSGPQAQEGAASQVFWLLVGAPSEIRPVHVLLIVALAAGGGYVLITRRYGGRLPRRIGAPIAAALWLVLCLMLGKSFCLALFMLVAAVSAGLLVLRLIRCSPNDAHDRLLFSAGIGLGVLAYQTLGLGLLGAMNRWVHAGLLTAWVLAAFREWRRLFGDIPVPKPDRPWSDRWLVILAATAVVLSILAAWAPVTAYDSLEYHLAAPARHWRVGRIEFIPENVYANFPAHVETLYLLGMVLGGGPDAGLPTALLIQAAFGVLTALTVGRMTSRFFGPRAGRAAAAFFAACPLMVSTVFNAYTTLAECFYLVSAFYAFAQWASLTSPSSIENHSPYGESKIENSGAWLILSALCAGLAAATKYPGVVFVCVPIGLAVLIASRRVQHPWRKALIRASVFGLVAAAAFAPWMIRNVVYTRNPVYPLAYGIFDGKHWSPEQDAKFRKAHAPGPVSMRRAFKQTWRMLMCGPPDGDTGPPEGEFASGAAILFIPFLVLLRRRGSGFGVRGSDKTGEDSGELPARGSLLVLAIGFGAYWALWYFFTHRIDRFLSPALVFLCALSGAGYEAAFLRPRLRGAARGVALFAVGFSVFFQGVTALQAGALTVPFGAMTREQFFHGILDFEAMQAINRLPRERVNILFVGDAKTFYCHRPCTAPVVFNPHPLSPVVITAREDPAAALRELRTLGYTHLLVNWSELWRLSATYSFLWRGETVPGYLPEVDLKTGRPLTDLRRFCRMVHQGLMPTPDGGQYPVVELWEIP